MKKFLTLTLLLLGIANFSAENELRISARMGGGITLLKYKDGDTKDDTSGTRNTYLQGGIDISGHKVGYITSTSNTEVNLGGGVELGGGKFFGINDNNNKKSEYFYVNPYLKVEVGGEIADDFKLYGGASAGIIDTILTKEGSLKPGGLENRVGLTAKVYALGVYKERYTFEVGTGVGNSLGYLGVGLNFGI